MEDAFKRPNGRVLIQALSCPRVRRLGPENDTQDRLFAAPSVLRGVEFVPVIGNVVA